MLKRPLLRQKPLIQNTFFPLDPIIIPFYSTLFRIKGFKFFYKLILNRLSITYCTKKNTDDYVNRFSRIDSNLHVRQSYFFLLKKNRSILQQRIRKIVKIK